MGLKRLAPRNGGELFAPYCAACEYRTGYGDEGEPLAIPAGSRIVTSDDIFEYMLAARTRNEEIAEDTKRGKEDYASLKYGESIRFSGWENYENFRLQVLARTKSLSRRKFLQKLAGKEVRLRSNGETALDFFAEMLQNDTLYLLDEPENSLSPKMQLKLKALIEAKARYCGCQFLIATHSPFLLALERAKIYDLDSSPVTLKKWWELRIFLRQPKPVRQGIGRGSIVLPAPGLRRWRGISAHVIVFAGSLLPDAFAGIMYLRANVDRFARIVYNGNRTSRAFRRYVSAVAVLK